MLTVVVGRAVFGSTIGAGETWAKIRGRLPALIGLVALESAGLILLAGLVGLIVGAIAVAGNAAAAIVIGLPLVLVSIATVVYLYTVLSFAPVLIVLERLPVIDAITRSFALVRNSFWRVLGIRLLTWVVVVLIAGAVAAPFNFLGHLLGGPSGPELIGATVGAVGSAIGRIITAPFSAGVVVLLYTDRRIRAEAFDLVLQTGAAAGPHADRIHRLPLADAAGVRTSRGCPQSTSTAIPRTRLAQRELDKPIYPKGSVTQRLHEWIHELLYRLLEQGSSLPGGWFTVSVLLTLLAVAVVIGYPHRTTHHTHPPRRRLSAVRRRSAQRRPASRYRGTLCCRRELDCCDSSSTACGGPWPRGDRDTEPGSRPHRQRAGR